MATLELEHCIGGIYTIPDSLFLHPNGKNTISVAGASIVISDITDPHNQTFLKGHTGTICCISMSANGKYIASGQLGDDADVFVWDFDSKKLIHKLCQHEHGVSTIAFTSDGRLLLTVGDFFDRKLFVWDMVSGGIVSNVQLSSTGSASVHATTTDKRPPPQPSRMTASSASTKSSSAASMGEGDFVAAAWGGRARDIKRRETSDFIFATAGPNVSLWTLTPSTGDLRQDKFQAGATARSYTSVAFTSDGERCIAGTTSGDFAVFLVRTLALEMMVPACSNGIRSLTITPTNGILVGGGDGTLTLFRQSARTFVPTHQTKIGDARMAVTCLSTGNAETRCIVASVDGTVYSVSLVDFKVVPLFYSHSGPVSSLAFPITLSDKFATCSPDDDTVRVWDLSTYDTLSLCSVPKQHPLCLAWCGDCLTVGYQSGEVRFVDAYSGDVLWTLVGAHKDSCTAIAATDSASLIVSGGEGGELRLWDVKTRKMQAHLKEHSQAVTSIGLFKSSPHFVSSSRDRSWSCVDMARERRVATYKARSSIHSLSLLPDEKRVITACSDRSIVFWDLAVSDPVKVLTDAHDEQITTISACHDADMFATGSADSVVKLWDLSGKLLGEFPGHSAAINAIGFTPDDKQLVSVGDDGNVLVWNLF